MSRRAQPVPDILLLAVMASAGNVTLQAAIGAA